MRMDEETLLPAGVELERDDANGCYRVRYGEADAPPSTVAVTAVAAVIGTDPVELDPVWESVDPDALDDLFRSTTGGQVRDSGRVAFSVAGYRVVMDASGEMEISPPDAASSRERF